ncbi:MAG: lectin-like protein [Gammaproteobacteria bacterium]
MTWSNAQTYCRQYHTDLASSRDEAQHLALKALTSGYTWIGLFRDSWKWVDQTWFSTVKPMTKRINNALGNESCGYINKTQAADARCSDILPFVCYAGEVKSSLGDHR